MPIYVSLAVTYDFITTEEQGSVLLGGSLTAVAVCELICMCGTDFSNFGEELQVLSRDQRLVRDLEAENELPTSSMAESTAIDIDSEGSCNHPYRLRNTRTGKANVCKAFQRFL